MHYLTDKDLQDTISKFLERYGISGLKQALQSYDNMQQKYLCKSKTSVSKIRLRDIYYLEITGHHITVHTEHETYKKYGALNRELEYLSPYGFVKCNQSCIVSLQKIRSILGNDIILINHEHLYLSRHYASKVLIAFSHNHLPN